MLLRYPPLPIKIDYNYYLENKEFFNTISNNERLEKEKVEKYLNENLELSYFLEEIKDGEKT